MKKIIESRSPAETEAAGAALAGYLLDVSPESLFFVCLTGDLGAGKTAFVRGFSSVLSPESRVKSPTDTVVNEYNGGRLELFHFDMYRLGSSDELFDIGWEDYLLRGGVCAVEWSENVSDAMEDANTVRIEKASEEERIITIEGGVGLEDLEF